MEVAAVSGVAVGSAAFSYNRENFLYDREQRFRKEIAVRTFRIEQASLWRKDVRDIISLTEYKMHIYLLINALMLGFTVILWCEGRLPENTPQWLMAGFSISTAGAFIFLLLSIWLAMHAAVAAQSYEARLLTQLVRLPVPTWQEVEACRTYASEFEGTESRQMFRIPFVMGRQEDLVEREPPAPAPQLGQPRPSQSESAPVELTQQDSYSSLDADIESQQPADAAEGEKLQHTDPWGLERSGGDLAELGTPSGDDIATLRHIRLARQAANFWQTADAFARVSMSVGVNQLLLGLTYYMLGYILVQVGSETTASYGVVSLVVLAECHLKLDMSRATLKGRLLQVLLAGGPALAMVAGWCWAKLTDFDQRTAEAMMAAAYMTHGLYLIVMLTLCRVKEQDNGALLPEFFRSVLYLDVFARDGSSEDSQDNYTSPSQPRGASRRGDQPRTSSEAAHSKLGPAWQAVRYDSESMAPIPQRPEDLAPQGAVEDMRNVPGVPQAQGVRPQQEDEDFWDPSSFLAGNTLVQSEDIQVDEYPREVTPPLRGLDSFAIDETDNSFHSVATGHQKSNPSILPERTFKTAMIVLSLIWISAGIFGVLEATKAVTFGQLNSGSEITEEVPWVWAPTVEKMNERKIFRSLADRMDATEVAFHGPNLMQLYAYGFTGRHLFFGMEQIPVAWPFAGFEPHSLACDSTGLNLAVTDGLSIFTTDLKPSNSLLSSYSSWLTTTSTESATFVEVPCQELEGQGLQDLQMACDVDKQKCDVLVLHGNGRKLSSCQLHNQAGKELSRTGAIAQEWLEVTHDDPEEIAAGRVPPSEKPLTLSLDPGCDDNDKFGCAFVGTTRGRVVQLRQGMNNKHLVPSNIVQDDETISGSIMSGRVRLLNSKLLGILQPHRQSIQVLDVTKGGLNAGRLMLPLSTTSATFCAGGKYLYLLTKESEPQLWRFALPHSLVDK